MIGKKIINKIIKEGLVSADSERVSVWREDAVSVLNGFVDYLISQEGKKVACESCSKVENEEIVMNKNSTEIDGQKIDDEKILGAALLMAKQTMFPEIYESFLECYDYIIEVRSLNLEQLSEWKTNGSEPMHEKKEIHRMTEECIKRVNRRNRLNRRRAFSRKLKRLVGFFMKDQWRSEGRCIACGSGNVAYVKQGSSPMLSVECLMCKHKYDA